MKKADEESPWPKHWKKIQPLFEFYCQKHLQVKYGNFSIQKLHITKFVLLIIKPEWKIPFLLGEKAGRR